MMKATLCLAFVFLASFPGEITCDCKNNTTSEPLYQDQPVAAPPPPPYAQIRRTQMVPLSVPDEYLTVPSLIRKHGYPSETHNFNTPDNYFLKVHRIPHGKTCAHARDKPVVLLQHGLFGSSADWVVSGPKYSFAYMLADAGYDVWLGNSRGNVYSDGHAYLNTGDVKYWNFSWEEMGELDLAATIDYILDITGQRCLYYIGHSMGSAVFFILMSSQPQYNAKIRASFQLAPGFYFLNNFNFQSVKNTTAVGEFRVKEPMQDDFERWNCYKQGGVPGIGYLPSIVSHQFAGTSTKAFIHYSQAVLCGELFQFDYGIVANLEIYGCVHPPAYNLSLITSPVHIYYSALDPVAGSCEVNQLAKKLPNVMSVCEVPSYTHLDFLWGVNSKKDIYDEILVHMKRSYGSCYTGNPVCGKDY
ncbi:hypothetical protein C0J52_00361 [Blattella germanica]|nr:hypothetical protein C0J52_00361 [Blattella germanica]